MNSLLLNVLLITAQKPAVEAGDRAVLPGRRRLRKPGRNMPPPMVLADIQNDGRGAFNDIRKIG